MGIKGIKILRVYGNFIEQKKFPIPNRIQPTRPIASEEELRVPRNLRSIALHHVIRNKKTSPYAKRLRSLERHFAERKKKKKKVDETIVEEYLTVITHQWKRSYPRYLIQVNLSNTDTEGTEQSVRIIEVYMVLSRSSSSVRVVLSICLLFWWSVNCSSVSFKTRIVVTSTGLGEVVSAKSRLVNFIH